MKVSVIIAARNAAQTVDRAILSAIGQTLTDLEVIVVDDGSSDTTASVVTTLAQSDSRVRLIRHSSSRGVSAARNTAISAARGEWFAVLDADDWFSPERMQVLISVADQRKLDVVIDNINRVSAPDGLSLGEAFPHEWMKLTTPLPVSFLIERDIPYRQKIGFGYCKPVFNRNAFISSVGTYSERLKCSEDVLALQMMLFDGRRAGVTDKAMYFYTVDPQSHSNRHGVNIDIARVNRLIKCFARTSCPALTSLLNERQDIIEYDALRKAFNGRHLSETIYFLWRIRKRLLCLQLLRGLAGRLGIHTTIVDPRTHA